MSEFYTSVSLGYNDILYRGYEDGKRVQGKIPYAPTMYLEGATSDEIKSLYGVPLTPKKFESLRDANDFVKTFGGMKTIYGYPARSMHYQFIAENFKDDLVVGIQDVRVLSLDIETEVGESGFPNPLEAKEPISLITTQEINSGRLITFGYQTTNIDNFVLCTSEKDMLVKFIRHIMDYDPDIITGWNIKGFDVPYIINRIDNVLGEKATSKLSPFGKIDIKDENIKGRETKVYTIVGRSVLDLLDLYQKFTFVRRESYKLDHIAFVELKKNKLENPFSTFKEFYTGTGDVEIDDGTELGHLAYVRTQMKLSGDIESDEYIDLDRKVKQLAWDTFVRYNQIDTILVSELENKLGLVSLALSLAYLTKINYNDVFSPVKMWEMFILGYLMMVEKTFCDIERGGESGDGFIGAYVHDPKQGFYDWIISLDLASLYPNIMRMLNLSPETLVDVIEEATEESFLNGTVDYSGTEYTVAANGARFRKDKQGILAKMVGFTLDGRAIAKKEMLKYKEEKEKILTELNKRGVVH